jgi:tRNA(fMet)-specific endonuclease VapC
MGRRESIVKLLDTCFLIHLHREWVKKQPGPATRYLEQHHEEEFNISVITTLEFLEGFDEMADGQRFLTPFPSLPVSANVAHIGNRIRRDLRKRGEMIGDFDILIAATAIEAAVPVVTDNLNHFNRIEGLVVESYR